MAKKSNTYRSFEIDEFHDQVIICQGYPRCLLSGEDVMIEQLDGCVWCMKLHTDSEGKEFVDEPGEA